MDRKKDGDKDREKHTQGQKFRGRGERKGVEEGRREVL